MVVNSDVERMQKSNFIPHYSAIKGHVNREDNFNKNNLGICRVIAQLRLNASRIFVDGRSTKFDDFCKYCGQSESLEHMCNDCPGYKLVRERYLVHLNFDVLSYISDTNQLKTKCRNVFLFVLYALRQRNI